MFEPIVLTLVLVIFTTLIFLTFYAPVRTAILLIKRENPLSEVSRLWYLMSAGLSFMASGYALLINLVRHSKYDYPVIFLSLSGYLLLQALTMAVMMCKSRAPSKLDNYL
ncbi:hypothetical protein GIV19_18250 [Pseudomonas syringae]|uniref:hypothetical protein n=1 Tax=Pseudomonas syringae TaxID=317 RepID=UPI001F2D7FED|nr:hypothetical protein [Pseudomonas syringae]MCF5709213.1 hypothetical protein [Pseudomonas syringae]